MVHVVGTKELRQLPSCQSPAPSLQSCSFTDKSFEGARGEGHRTGRRALRGRGGGWEPEHDDMIDRARSLRRMTWDCKSMMTGDECVA